MGTLTINLSDNPIAFEQPGDTITFKLINSFSVYSGTEEHTLIDFGSFELGSDDEDESVFFPGNIDVSFKLDADVFKFENIVRELKTKTVIAQIFINSSKVYSGYVSNEDVTGMKNTQLIKLKIIDQFKRLESYASSNDALVPNLYSDPLEYKNIFDLIRGLLTNGAVYADPYISTIVNLHTLEVQIESGWYPFATFATRIFRYFNKNIFEDCLQILKALIYNYGCIGVIGFDCKFYIYPRKYYDGAASFELNQTNLMSEPELTTIPKKDSLMMDVYRFYQVAGSSPASYVPAEPEKYVGFKSDLSDDDNTEKIQMVDVGGVLPSGLYTEGQSLYLGTPQDYTPILYRIKKPDGTYFESTKLYELVSEYIWSAIGEDRKNYSVDVKGSFRDIHFGQFYYFADNPTQFYRLRKAAYNLKTKTATLDLIDATNIEINPSLEVQINHLIDAPTATLENDLFTISIESIWRLRSDEKVYAVFDNFFATSPSTLTLYNGTSITIPIDQRDKVAKSVKNYIVYLAVAKNGNAPQYSYPNADDNQADWYLIDHYPDSNHYDPEYQYKFLLPDLSVIHKKFWLWMGVQLKNAPVIFGIRRHPKLGWSHGEEK